MSPAHVEPGVLLRHAAHVRELARRLVFDAEAARDVEQETWLAALEHAPRDVRDPRAWLASVVRHAARRVWARGERARDVDDQAARQRASEGEGSPPDLLEREQALRALFAAVDRLPEPVRTAIVMHHLDGLSLREAATRTRAPLETVRSRVKRGLALLRDDLARERRGGAGWSLVLVRALELDPPGPGHGLLACARGLVSPVLIMSSTSKLAAALAGVALTLLAGWLWLARAPSAARSVASSAAAAPPVEIPSPDVAPDAREAAALPSESASEQTSALDSEAARTGALRIALVWADDATPAARTAVGISPSGDASSSARTRHESSDAGSIAVDELAPGTYSIQPLLGGFAMVAVRAGETTEVAVEIPQGIAVRGRVVERGGAAVAGAAIYLSPGGYDAQYDGAVVALSDARGLFAVRTVPAGVGACLSARAAGRAPTEQVMLTGAPRSSVELELAFDRAGRELAGRVVGPRGEPVAGAQVLIGSEREFLARPRADGTVALRPIGQLARTGADGRFEVQGAPLGEALVQARARGYPPWRGTLAQDGERWIDIQLELGASVRGVARASDGTPLAGVRVSTEIENAFAGAVALSAADGGYSLEPLASGACELVAEGGEHGRTRASFVLAAGQEQRWDPTFDASRAIRGRVVAQGEALDGWTVRGYAPPGSNGEPPFVAEVTTGARGEFELTAVPERGVDVLLFGRGGTPFPVARRTGVTPGASELVLRPDPELAPSARIVGQLVDAAGSAVRNADVRALHETLGGTLVHPDAEGGTFAIGPLPPGEWTLEVDAHAAGWGVARATRHLAADETWDVGALPLGEGGTLAVSLVREATSAPATLALEIRDAHGRTVDWLTLEGDDVRSRPLAPGEYEIVSLADATLEPARRSFAIVGGQETRVELRAKP